MPWSHDVETMGFEPTTPCLQTVGLKRDDSADLARNWHRAAPARLPRTGGVARVWPRSATRLQAPRRGRGSRSTLIKVS
jgi:hypothetical protein